LVFRYLKRFGRAIASKRRMAKTRTLHRQSRRAAHMRQSATEGLNFIIYRILGNDLAPRHRIGQTQENLKYIIEREANFPDCERRFVVNRILDKEREEAIIDMLEGAGLGYVRIPFDPDEYARCGWQTEPFGGAEYFQSAPFSSLNEADQERVRIWACAPKICYAMNVNGARNIALDEGRSRADWVLPLDGNCFVTNECFEAFRRSCIDLPEMPCRIIPMVRTATNTSLPNVSSNHDHAEEPQLCFHRTTKIRFNEMFPYGIRDKAELIMRLGVPGFWDKWGAPDWLPDQQFDETERYLFTTIQGSVVRLSSGIAEGDIASDNRIRYRSRNNAILATIKSLDKRFCRDDPVFTKILS
jgi:hypothetical protein